MLDAPSWRQFGARAVDGMLWTLSATGAISIDTGGANAYPPHGEGGRSATFDRLMLASSRMLGKEVWPHPPASAFALIPDERSARST